MKNNTENTKNNNDSFFNIENINNTKKLFRIIFNIKEYYFMIKASQYNDLININHMGVFLFAENKIFINNKLTTAQIIILIQKRIVKLSDEFGLSVNLINRELNKPENNLQRYFVDKIYNFFLQINGKYPDGLPNAIKNEDYNKIFLLAKSIIYKKYEAREIRNNTKNSISNLIMNRKLNGNEILSSKESVSSTNIKLDSLENLVDNLLRNIKAEIKRPNDIQEYKKFFEGIELNSENIRKIFEIYKKKLNIYCKSNLEINIIASILKYGFDAKNNGENILNDHQAKTYLEDKLSINISPMVLKIFYSEYKK